MPPAHDLFDVDAVADAYGLGSLSDVGRVPGCGQKNFFRLDASHGSAFVRYHGTRAELTAHRHALVSYEMHTAMSAYRASVATPSPLMSTSDFALTPNGLVAEVPSPTNGERSVVSAFAWFDGVHPSSNMKDEVLTAIAEQLGESLARLHASTYDPKTRMATCHDDLDPNILVQEQQGVTKIALIDFETAMPGYPWVNMKGAQGFFRHLLPDVGIATRLGGVVLDSYYEELLRHHLDPKEVLVDLMTLMRGNPGKSLGADR